MPTMRPMIVPPTAPRIRIGAKALVMMASGRLSRMPKIRPCAHAGTGKRAAPITKPIAKRLRKAPINAALLSGNESGIIEAADNAPYTRPQIVPSNIRDIAVGLYHSSKRTTNSGSGAITGDSMFDDPLLVG